MAAPEMPLPPWETTALERIKSSCSADAKERAILALVTDGASHERAVLAITNIVRRAASYLAGGPPRLVADTQVKAEITAVAEHAEGLLRAINAMSIDARARLDVSLAPERGFFGGRPRNLGNPDPLFESAPAGLTGLASLGSILSRRTVAPADMRAKFQRMHQDVFQLAAPLRRASDFRPKRGRPQNWYARQFLKHAILEWCEACGQSPPASQVEGQITSPLLTFLRDLVYPATDHVEMGEALSDSVYRSVLKQLKQGHGGLLRASRIPTRRRPGRNSRTRSV